MATPTLRPTQPAARTAVLASADLSFRQRVRDALTGLRWQVREAAGGAEALAHLDAAPAETVILDSWLPDLEIQEFITEFEKLHPGVDLVTVGDTPVRRNAARSPRRNEVLFALRRGQDTDGADGATWNLAHLRPLSLLLNDPDFRTAELVAASVNKTLGGNVAHAVDSRRIEITTSPGEDIPELLAQVESIEVQVFPRARVVVNERTGTIVIGGQVRLQPVSILHGGLVVNVISQTQVSQPGAFSSGTTQLVQQTTIQAQDKPANRIELREGATVDDLEQSLQQIGATARDIISILQAMKEAGALEADLEVM